MAFDANSGTLSCPSCGRQDEMESFSDDFIETIFEEDEAKEYHCNNCGADIVTDADTTATHCSFCGAAVVLADRVSGILAPSLVIPFTITKQQAEDAFRKWCRNGLLTPSDFKVADRIKKITGMYVPFWLYDLNNRAKVEATATRVRTYTRGDYIYTETKFYDVYRDLQIDFNRVPADASEKMDDALMDKLEPYHYQELKDFKTPYLAGYIAEKYNYDAKELLPRVKEKMSGPLDNYIRSTISGYSSVRYKNKNIRTTKSKSLYTLLPVWMVYYDYEQAEHIFAMNGQTGKVVGKPPLSKGKIAAWFGGIAAGSFLIMQIITFFVTGGGLF
jgi:DNA-directed RNA polymerase subunit RPC12/RpoP